MPTRTLLVIDDDARLGASLIDLLQTPDLEVLQAQTGREGLELCARRPVHVVLLDQVLPDMAGVELCRPILENDPRTKIVFMTAHPTFDNAVAAIKLGASDYLTKPFELEQLELAVQTALRIRDLERIEQVDQRRRRQERAEIAIAGARGGLCEAVRMADLAAPRSVPVLVTGETGTGKSLLAKYIHYTSPRSELPFVSVNCAALPATVAESELFGHEKGAFTDAVAPRRGVFEMAEGGTVFLDEIGAMPVELQAKLLGVLEDYAVRRVGGERTRRVEARVIAATNRDLAQALRRSEFRSDLFYRLGVLRIHLPPLRERQNDLPELCRRLTRDITGREVVVSEEELLGLRAYGWPGNVRELRNVLERALILQSEEAFAPSRLLREAEAPDQTPLARVPSAPEPLHEVERRHVLQVLAHHGGNLTRTAETLQVAVSTLKRKLERYGHRP